MNEPRFFSVWRDSIVYAAAILGTVAVAVSVAGAYRHHSASAKTDEIICDMPSMHQGSGKTSASTVVTRTGQQNPGQQVQPSQSPEQDNSFEDFTPASQEQEDDRRCERPNPNGQNPDQGGVDPKKIGCKCVRTCEKGQIQENVTCKRHCKPDQCDCPDPCKT